MAVINSVCVAQPIEHQPIDVGATACARARLMTTYGAIAAPIRIGRVPNASSSVIEEQVSNCVHREHTNQSREENFAKRSDFVLRTLPYARCD